VFFVCFFSFGISDAEDKQVTGRIRGTVKNLTNDKIVPQQEVTLYIYRNDAEVDNRSAVSDSNGDFEFSQLEIASSLSYRLMTRFHEADYTSPFIRLSPEHSEQIVALKVYSSSDDDAKIQITAHHIILQPIEGGFQIMEYIILENAGNTSYLTTSPEGNHIGLRLELPHGFKDLKPMQGLMECCLSFDGDTLLYSHASIPGPQTIIFTYQMPASPSATEQGRKRGKAASHVNLSRRLSFNTSKLLMLVAGEGYHLTFSALSVSGESQTLEVQQGDEEVFQGRTYRKYMANNLTKGQTVDIRLELPHERRFNPIWLSGIVLVVGLAGILIVRRLSTTRRLGDMSVGDSETPVSTTELEDLKRGYLELISKLDEMYKDGDISETAYKQLREEQKAKLGELMEK